MFFEVAGNSKGLTTDPTSVGFLSGMSSIKKNNDKLYKKLQIV